MAVAGHLRIHHEDGWLSDGWGLERTGAKSSPPTDPGQRKLLDSLFPGGKTRIELKKANATTISGARRAHTSALEKELQPRYFRRNAGSVTIALAIAVGTALPRVLSLGRGGHRGDRGGAGRDGADDRSVQPPRARADEGRPDAARPDRGAEALPERGRAGRARAAARAGRARRRSTPSATRRCSRTRWRWRSRTPGRRSSRPPPGRPPSRPPPRASPGTAAAGASDLGNLTQAVGSSLSSQIASSSSPPGSSSGRGGGGSSGGGGGGGGGGGR